MSGGSPERVPRKSTGISKTNLRRKSSVKREFTENELKDLRIAFDLLDRNQDGSITTSEMQFMFRKLGIELRDETVQELIKAASHTGNSLLNETEFLQWVKKIHNLLPEVADDDISKDLIAAFKVFDSDHNGYITRDELRTAMEMMGEKVTEEQLTEFINIADIDKDGKINYEVISSPTSPEVMDWSKYYPKYFPTSEVSTSESRVEFADVGCGYGGLLITLSTMFPTTLMVGMEIRVKVSDYVMDRIAALRTQNPGAYENIACIRTNAMKYLPNYFEKGQLKKMFFLYPDPHFKKAKHKWRIINTSLLAEYAYVLSVGGIIYTVTDVKDLHEWMVHHLEIHPLFSRMSEEVMKTDPIIEKLYNSTEEGQKVTRNNGDKFLAAFIRIADLIE